MLKKPKDGSIALFNFRVSWWFISFTHSLKFFSFVSLECFTVENGQDRLINYDTIKLYLIVQ